MRVLGSKFWVQSVGLSVEGSGFLKLRAVPTRTVLILRTTTSQNVKRFRGRLVCDAHRIVYHSALGWRVKKHKKCRVEGLHLGHKLLLLLLQRALRSRGLVSGLVSGLACRVQSWGFGI